VGRWAKSGGAGPRLPAQLGDAARLRKIVSDSGETRRAFFRLFYVRGAGGPGGREKGAASTRREGGLMKTHHFLSVIPGEYRRCACQGGRNLT